MATKTLANGTSITTTISTSKFDNGVIDISILPWIAEADVGFIGHKLRPEREIFFYFDGLNVTNYVQKPNILKLKANTDYRDLNSPGWPDTITCGSGNSAFILMKERDPITGNNVLYVSNVTGSFINAHATSVRGNASVVIGYLHYSGIAGGGTSNTITLAEDAQYMPNNYWGTDSSNSVYIVSGTGINQSNDITGYDNVSRKLSCASTWTTIPTSNSVYSIGDWETTVFGNIAGTFFIPNNDSIRFRVGDRIFRILDVDTGVLDDCSTRADYTFSALGLVQTKNQVKTTNITTEVYVPPLPTTPVTPDRDPTRPSIRNPIITIGTDHSPNGGDHDNSDPLAQTFFVPYRDYPNGIALTSVDLFFKRKDSNNLPVAIQIRPVVNGYPHSSEYVEDSVVTLSPNRVVTTDNPNTKNSATHTRFTFRSPIFLDPGEWCFVVMTKSTSYEVYTAEMGQVIIGPQFNQPRIMSEQPYSGSLFKSQNSSTWEAAQAEDLMFRIRRAVFTSSGTAVFKNKTPDPPWPSDQFFTHVHDQILGNTSIRYTHSIDGGGTFVDYEPDSHYRPTNRVNLTAAGDYQVTAELSTNDDAVSPILYHRRYMLLAIKHLINNANVTNNQIIITDESSGYSANQNVALRFGSTAGNTSPVVAFGLADSGGSMSSVIVTQGGANFIEDMTVTPASGSATFNFSSELDPFGGPAQCKYISRIVNLAEGFDAGDLRVYITASKISGTDIKLYYKIRNSLDPETFDNKRWILMEQFTPEATISSDERHYIEYEFRPSLTENQISYTTDDGVTYKTFQQFAFKIILLSDNTTKYPVVTDFRGFALPGDEV